MHPIHKTLTISTETLGDFVRFYFARSNFPMPTRAEAEFKFLVKPNGNLLIWWESKIKKGTICPMSYKLPD